MTRPTRAPPIRGVCFAEGRSALRGTDPASFDRLRSIRQSLGNPNNVYSDPSNDELLQANRYDLVSRLADDLAHEIKNPLNAIVINLEVLKVRVARQQPDQALERAAVIEQETRRLHGLVDRLLQLLRPLREDPGTLALDQLLDELLPLVEAQARLARNEFVIEGVAPVFVAVPRDVFKFAMLNLLGAAHEQLGQGDGTLVLRCSVDGPDVRLAVQAVNADGAALDLSAAPGIGLAGTLLAGSGGHVAATPAEVALVLPRAGAL